MPIGESLIVVSGGPSSAQASELAMREWILTLGEMRALLAHVIRSGPSFLSGTDSILSSAGILGVSQAAAYGVITYCLIGINSLTEIRL